MKTKYVAECSGTVEVRADLKRLALVKTSEMIKCTVKPLALAMGV